MDQKHYNMMNWEEVESIIYADCDNPFSVLGIHKKGKSKLVQTFFVDADEVEAVFVSDGKKKTLKLEKVDENGFFAEFFSFEYSSYCFNVKKGKQSFKNVYDPYSFDVSVDSNEFKNILKGKSVKAHEVFGCHKKSIDGIEGYEFVLYAPFATCVSLVGDFNEWKDNANLMQKDKKNQGIFYLFVPGIKDKSEYKYVIKSKGCKSYKNDPYAFGMANGNSLTIDLPKCDMKIKRNSYSDLQILEVNMSDLFERLKDKDKVLSYIEDSVIKFSYNSVKFLSLLSNVNDLYDVCNLFSIDLCDNTVDDYVYVINELKKKKINVFAEHPIAYLSSYEGGMSRFDSSYLYENEDYRLNYHKHYNALLLDYGKNLTRSYVFSSIDFLLKNFPVDGIVIPNVGVMLYHDYNKNPGEYITEEWNSTVNSANVNLIRDINGYIHAEYKGVITIASIYAYYDDVTGKDKNSLGFDYCFNTGACEEILDFFTLDLLKRREHLDSFLLFTHFDNKDENFIYPFSHIEKAKYSGLLQNSFPEDRINQLSNLKIAYIYKLLLEGSQLSDIDTVNLYGKDEDQIKFFTKFLVDLRKIYSEKKTLIKNFDNEKTFSYKCFDTQVITREYFDGDEEYLVVFNFSGESYPEYKLNVSKQGVFTECFNSDRKAYGGRGYVNKKPIETEDNDDEFGTISVKMPALSISAFSYRKFNDEEIEDRYQKKKARMIAYVDGETKKIKNKLNNDIKELEKKADAEIKELEKLLKPYDR